MEKKYFTDEAIHEAKHRLSQDGLSANAFARRHGFGSCAVSDVLSNRRSCRAGVGHNIAVLLGLKEGRLNPDYPPFQKTDAA